MEITIRVPELVKALQRVQGIVEKKTTMPILANALIKSKGKDKIIVGATDLEIGLVADYDAQIDKSGAMTLGAKALYDIVRSLPEKTVTLKQTANQWVEISCGKVKYRVVGMAPESFPTLPTFEDVPFFALEPQTFREMIDKTLYAVSADETRFNLSGVFLTNGDEGNLRMVATDGHRLAMVDRRLPDARIERGVIMPRKGLTEARKLLDSTEDDEVTLTVAAKDVRLSLRTVSFFMRLVEGEFPDYRQVIPGAARAQARANRDDLLAALRRISLLASERSRGVKLHLEKGRLELSASNPDQGEASEDIEVSYGGEPITIGFNARYLIDVLGVHGEGDVIEISLTDEVGPGLLRGSQDPEYTYVVMPMRL